MKIRTIAVDIDDVLIGLLDAWLDYLNNKHNLSVKRDMVINWDMHRVYPTLTDEELYGVLKEPEFWESVTPLRYARPYLYKLYKENYKIILVTASHYSTLVPKFDLVLFAYFNFLNYKDVIVCNDKYLIDADVLIDDNPENFVGFKGYKILVTAPYNTTCSKDFYDYRVNNLKEAYNVISELNNLQ